MEEQNANLMAGYINFVKDKDFDNSNDLKPVQNTEKAKKDWLSSGLEKNRKTSG